MWNIFPNHLINQLGGIHFFSLDAVLILKKNPPLSLSNFHKQVFLTWLLNFSPILVYYTPKKYITFKTLVSV